VGLSVVISAGKHPDFMFKDLIDKPVFLVYPARPAARKLIF
jgi:hypothetical protein